jgi:hypothetical protein
MLHKFTFFDYEDEDEDDINKTVLPNTKHDICQLNYSNFSEPTGSDDIQNLVAAKSRTVENLSREIAETIKSLSEGKAAAQ